MNVLLVPDSFKGCLSSQEVCKALAAGINKADRSINIMQFPSSDGGEGFCDCMQNIFGGERIEKRVTFPLGNKGKASFLFVPYYNIAYIELASCAGLSLVPPRKRNIMAGTTYGLGELILAAAEYGARKIVVGLGGSATNDCGFGMLSALGVRFYDDKHDLLPPITSSLLKVVSFDIGEMINLSHIQFYAACDVSNPLYGEHGAAKVFARQKGATDEQIEQLDKAGEFFAALLGFDATREGCGAAGGVGFAMMCGLDATYKSGASYLLKSDAFHDALCKADLIITGEGNTDAQTAYGKLVGSVVNIARMNRIPSIVISGGLSDGYEKILDLGAKACYSLVDETFDKEYCMLHASEMLSQKIYEIFQSMI